MVTPVGGSELPSPLRAGGERVGVRLLGVDVLAAPEPGGPGGDQAGDDGEVEGGVQAGLRNGLEISDGKKPAPVERRLVGRATGAPAPVRPAGAGPG